MHRLCTAAFTNINAQTELMIVDDVMCAEQLTVQLCGSTTPFGDRLLYIFQILMPSTTKSYGLIYRYVSHIAAGATCRYNGGDGSTYAQPQINPLSATENPHSLIEMTRLLGTVAPLTA